MVARPKSLERLRAIDQNNFRLVVWKTFKQPIQRSALVTVARPHDQIDRRVFLASAEVFNTLADDAEIPLAKLKRSPGAGGSPVRDGLETTGLRPPPVK